jgi:hypothetical protein
MKFRNEISSNLLREGFEEPHNRLTGGVRQELNIELQILIERAIALARICKAIFRN